MLEQWGDVRAVLRGTLYSIDTLPGFLAFEEGECIGLITYVIKADACEIASINSTREGRGVGSRLIEAVKSVARQAGCHRLWLITTNDNMHALRFYQKRGFELVAIHRNALAESRKIKPTIPLYGYDSIPLRDEIELEMYLVGQGSN